MKALIENIQFFSLHDGPGTRTTIFFKGCPLKCLWCSNPTTQIATQEIIHKTDLCIRCRKCELLCPQKAINFENNKIIIDRIKCDNCGKCVEACLVGAMQFAAKEYEIEEVFNLIKKDILFYQNTGGGVTFSGGEMLMQYQFVSALIDKCKTLNIHTAAETSGFAQFNILYQIVSKLDLCFYDIKHIDSDKHKEITGKDNKIILENLEQLLIKTNTPICIRLPLIPTINDDNDHLICYAKYLSSLPNVKDFEILPYHRLGSGKYELLGREYTLSSLTPYSEDEIKDKVNLIRKYCKNVNVICKY